MCFSKIKRCLIAGVCGVTFIAGHNLLYAQMGYDLYSIEWLVAEADAVAQGRVIDVRHEAIDQQRRSTTVTLAVSEKIKGVVPPKIDFVIETHVSDDHFNTWKQSQRAILWFLARTQAGDTHGKHQVDNSSSRIRWMPVADLYAIELPKTPTERLSRIPPPPIYSLDLTLLKTRDEILTAAHRASQELDSKTKPRSHKLEISHEIAQRTGRSGDINRLTVPVVKQLEKVASDWTNAPEMTLRRIEIPAEKDKIPPLSMTDIGLMRVQGIRAMRYFRTDKNIQTLRALLNDTSLAYRTIVRADGSTAEEKTYYVREEAKRVLKDWGVEVECSAGQ